MKLKEERKEEEKVEKTMKEKKSIGCNVYKILIFVSLSLLIQLPCKDNTASFKRVAKLFFPDLLQHKIFIPNFQYHIQTLK